MIELVSKLGAASDEVTYAPCAAEVAECTCPEPCERDHDND
jgi:hypothetical protein